MVINREWWYNQDFVLFNMIPHLKHRYLSVKKTNPDREKDKKKYIQIRYYMGYKKVLLVDSIRRLNVINDTSANLYFDLAQWKDKDGNTPLFNFEKEKRKEQKKAFTGNISKGDGTYLDLMAGYDYAIDIDAKDLKKAWKDAKPIKDIFDQYKIPYSLKFSGSKGFHFVIDYKWITLNFKPTELGEKFATITNNLIIDLKLKYVDDTIYDHRRVLKLPYSLCNKEGKEYVCLPLTDEQFEGFKVENMELQNVANLRLFKRGIIERDFGLDEKQLKDNCLQFMEDYLHE